MTLAFPITGSHLAWKVGNGTQVRVGADAIVGCGNVIFLLAAVIHHVKY